MTSPQDAIEAVGDKDRAYNEGRNDGLEEAARIAEQRGVWIITPQTPDNIAAAIRSHIKAQRNA